MEFYCNLFALNIKRRNQLEDLGTGWKIILKITTEK
jgi:hypothetical protein